MMRLVLNRVIVATTLLVALPMATLADRLHRGWGRRVAFAAARGCARLCGIRVVVNGSVPAGTTVLVPNHTSIIDIPALMVASPAVTFLAAEELFSKPLLGGAMRAFGAYPIDRHDRADARRQIDFVIDLPEPFCLVIFAEGGIVPVGERRPFRSGAFVVAIETGATIVPVALRGTLDVLRPKTLLGARPGTITVDFLEPIPTEGLTIKDRKTVRDATRAAIDAVLATDL